MPYRAELRRPDLKGTFRCSLCNKIFCHSSSLSRHRMQAHFKSYTCTLCNKEITSNETLRAHMFKVHQISRMFMCRCCNWAFPDKTSLHIHVQSMASAGSPGNVSIIAKSTTEGGSNGSPPPSLVGSSIFPSLPSARDDLINRLRERAMQAQAQGMFQSINPETGELINPDESMDNDDEISARMRTLGAKRIKLSPKHEPLEGGEEGNAAQWSDDDENNGIEYDTIDYNDADSFIDTEYDEIDNEQAAAAESSPQTQQQQHTHVVKQSSPTKSSANSQAARNAAANAAAAAAIMNGHFSHFAAMAAIKSEPICDTTLNLSMKNNHASLGANSSAFRQSPHSSLPGGSQAGSPFHAALSQAQIQATIDAIGNAAAAAAAAAQNNPNLPILRSAISASPLNSLMYHKKLNSVLRKGINDSAAQGFLHGAPQPPPLAHSKQQHQSANASGGFGQNNALASSFTPPPSVEVNSDGAPTSGSSNNGISPAPSHGSSSISPPQACKSGECFQCRVLQGRLSLAENRNQFQTDKCVSLESKVSRLESRIVTLESNTRRYESEGKLLSDHCELLERKILSCQEKTLRLLQEGDLANAEEMKIFLQGILDMCRLK